MVSIFSIRMIFLPGRRQPLLRFLNTEDYTSDVPTAQAAPAGKNAVTIHPTPVRSHTPLAALTVLLALVIAAPMAAYAQAQPEMHTGFTPKKAVHAKSFMISVANPHAARAGYDILKRGGAAVDAAIAASLVLGLVEPQSSGIGGGGYLLHWSARDRKVDSYDGRSRAPAAVKPDHFLEADGTPVSRRAAHFGGRTVGVPGVPHLFALTHRRHGKLPWKELFEPTIQLAERGFAVSPRLHKQINRNRKLLRDPAARAYLLNGNGEAWPAGHRLVNPAYAATLRTLAAHGADAFYTGTIGRDIAKAVTLAVEHPAPMTVEDVQTYRAIQNAPACVTYRRHRICGGGPSTTGGITLGMTLGLLEPFDLRALGADSPDAVHLFIEASRLAFADRVRYIADPAFVSVPASGLLDRGYLARRAKRINPSRAMARPGPGTPPMKKAMRTAPGDEAEPPSTSHLAVVDAEGNAVSFTTSIGRGFGSGIMVRGFLLNDDLVAFAFRPARDGIPVANRPDGGKRPRSSMSPTIVLAPDGALRLVVGSPGGIRILNYVAKTVVAVLDWDMDIQSAIELPHFGARTKHAELEKGTAAKRFRAALEAKGHSVKIRHLTSGLHGIEVTKHGLTGGADPRREGMAMGK
jgi:gamma-glutamyltranspeptidase/glutathione hydrolase